MKAKDSFFQCLPVPPDELQGRIGQEIGCTAWRAVPQEQIDGFADATGDWQFIHTDPERARRETPFGGSIAHGFLVLSLLSGMAYEVLPPLAGASMSLNYGFDKIRFLAPVPCGARIRGRFVLREVSVSAERVRSRYEATVEIEGNNRPALVAEWIMLAELKGERRDDSI